MNSQLYIILSCKILQSWSIQMWILAKSIIFVKIVDWRNTISNSEL